MQRRADMLARVRSYFADHDVMAVDTPALGDNGVTDPHINAIKTVDGAFLQTSSEYYMKRLLAAGYPDIYSIGHVFRDGESGQHHLSEFTMIEWYRLGLQLDGIIDDTLRLVGAALNRPELQSTAERYDYIELFCERCNLDPLRASIDELAASCNAESSLVDSLTDDHDAWLDLLLATRVVPSLAKDRLTIIAHYPASQAALARLCPTNARVADRFEVFYGNLELANGYVELTDAGEQARRMREDNEKRHRLGKKAIGADENLLAALGAGLPDCAGVALGFERLQMIDENAINIRDTVTFADR